MPRPGLRLAGAALLGLATFAYGATSEVAWLFLLAYWTWAVALAALMYAAWSARGLDATVELDAEPRPGSPLDVLPALVLDAAPHPPRFEGDRLEAVSRLSSRRGARGPVAVAARVAGQPLELAAGAVGPGGMLVRTPLGPARRGVVALNAGRLEAGDPAGVAVIRRPLADRELGIVYPVFAPLSSRRRLDDVDDATSASRPAAGLEVFGVREYRSGDPLRRIHWRLSARHGNLVVREYAPPGLRSLLLVMDPKPAPRAADQAARIAASEAWDCLDAGGRVVLWAAGLAASGGRSDLWSLLDWLARWPDVPADDGAPPPSGEVVAVTTTGAALEALELARRRGRPARAWLVGDLDAVDTTVPAERVGLEWPL